MLRWSLVSLSVSVAKSPQPFAAAQQSQMCAYGEQAERCRTSHSRTWKSGCRGGLWRVSVVTGRWPVRQVEAVAVSIRPVLPVASIVVPATGLQWICSMVVPLRATS